MKKAFTLSEALVTLAIIGVLAAILIPIINNVRPDKDKIVYKKALYNLQNAISNAMDSAYVSDGDGVSWGSGTDWSSGADWGVAGGGWGDYGTNGANVSNYYDWYGSGGSGSGSGSSSSGGSGSSGSGSGSGSGSEGNSFCKVVADSLNTVGTVNCDGPSSYTSPNFITSDGIRYWGLEDDSSFNIKGEKEIFVDRKVSTSELTGNLTRIRGRATTSDSSLGMKIKIRKDGKVYTPDDESYEYENGLIEESLDITSKK